MENIETVNTIAIANITKSRLVKNGSEFAVVCSCGFVTSNYPSDLDAKIEFQIHWTTKPFCTPKD